MKSPADIVVRLKRQWQSPQRREARLLQGHLSWPVVETIGKPKSKILIDNLDAVIDHIRRWQNVTVGKVNWEYVSYRATAEPVRVPISWQLNKPSDWISACQDNAIRDEFNLMSTLVANVMPVFHSLLIKRRSLWAGKSETEILQACRLASDLSPGCANGKPLRSLSIGGIDTKFFERNSRLITQLLDARYDGEVSQTGLETFLDALPEGEHWLLLVDLDGGLLPFRKQRVSTCELASAPLPGTHVLIVENERCLHQLPVRLSGTLVVLGAGFDLDWTANSALHTKSVAYWGDIDTWGLTCLARARQHLPDVQALLMTEEIYQQHINAAVAEPIVAGADIPEYLRDRERELYVSLLNCEKGRLEQEYLGVDAVRAAVNLWRHE